MTLPVLCIVVTGLTSAYCATNAIFFRAPGPPRLVDTTLAVLFGLLCVGMIVAVRRRRINDFQGVPRPQPLGPRPTLVVGTLLSGWFAVTAFRSALRARAEEAHGIQQTADTVEALLFGALALFVATVFVRHWRRAKSTSSQPS